MARRIETIDDLQAIIDEQNTKIAALETRLLGLIDIQGDTLRKMQASFDKISGELRQAVLEAQARTSGRKGPVN